MLSTRSRQVGSFATVALLLASMAALLPPGAAAQPAPPGTLDWVAAWLGAFDKDGDRVDDAAEMRARVLLAAGIPAEPVGVLVTFDHAPTDQDRATLALRGASAVHPFQYIPTVSALVPAHAVGGLGTLPGVAAVEWDMPLQPSLTISAPATQAHDFEGSGANAVYNGDTAQGLGYNGEGMVVAVVDTGVQEVHESFTGKLVTAVQVVLTDQTAGTVCNNLPDEIGHGTHVASTAIGDDPDGPNDGTARAARLVEVKLGTAAAITVAGVSIGSVNRGFEFTMRYNDAIDAGAPLCGVGAADRIDVVTLSFGSQGRGGPNAGSTEPLVAGMTQRGMVVTISAGNCGPSPSATCNFGDDESGIGSPANAAGSLAVANSNDRNTVDRGDDVLSSSSSRGPNAATTAAGNAQAADGATGFANLRDRHRKPEVAAPGTAIVAADSVNPTGYVSLSGTSMAAPHVAGLAALLLQAGEEAKAETGGVNLMRPTGTGYDAAGAHVPGQHPVRDALIHGADYKTAGVPADMLAKWEGPGADDLGWNNGYGYGHVNAFGALCWAWANVLGPAGATPSQAVSEGCLGGGPLTASAGGDYTGFVGVAVPLAGDADGGAPPYAFAWDLDADGAFDDATGSNPLATFAAPGAYTVALQVTDSHGTTANDSALATIRDLSPEQVAGAWAFDAADGACDEQGWFDAVAFATSTNPNLIRTPGPPWHLTTVQPSSPACAWYHGVDGARLYTDAASRNLFMPCVFAPPGNAGGTLAFDLAGNLEATFDFLYLQVFKGCAPLVAPGVTQTGLAFETLRTWTGVVGDLGASPPVYARQTVDLAKVLAGGGFFHFRLRFESDLNVEEVGYQVDDAELRIRDHPPAIAIAGPTTGDEGSVLAFMVQGTDPDGDPVTLTAEGLPEGATFDAATGAFSWTPGHGDIGTHAVAFTVSDGLLETRQDVVLTALNLPPTPAGSASPRETDRLTPVQFTDASTDPNGGSVVAWTWAFGDGATSAEQNPTHLYSKLGTKEVFLTATDEHGASTAALVTTVKVKNIPPRSRFGGNGGGNADGGGPGAELPGTAEAGVILANRVAPVQFSDLSTDLDGTVAAWHWQFGDGTTSTLQHPTHQYALLGDFAVLLTVTDNDGDIHTYAQTVRVVNLLPSVAFVHSSTYPTAFVPEFFDSTAQDPDGGIATYAWAFGDGGTSSLADPSHMYLQGGTYTVTLTVSDNDGGQATVAQPLYVCAPEADAEALVEGLEHVRLEFEACLRVNPDSLAGLVEALPT